jgi:hypothetical protein
MTRSGSSGRGGIIAVRTQSVIVALSNRGWDKPSWAGAAGAQILRDVIEGLNGPIHQWYPMQGQ